MTFRHTTVDAVSNLVELRRMVARLIPHLDWRYNGQGMLQAYVTEGETEETRIHIWHPNLKKPGIEGTGKLHNHRYTLRSTVLYGAIEHTEYLLTEDNEGAYQTFSVMSAREGMRATKSLDSLVRNEPQRYDVASFMQRMPPGDVYTFQKRAFHGTAVRGLTITIFSKFDQDDTPARVLAPMGTKPVYAFANPLPRERWVPYFRDAVVALERMP